MLRTWTNTAQVYLISFKELKQCFNNITEDSSRSNRLGKVCF